MVFRLPTHLESFIPPPANQVHPNTSDSTVAKPWRGRFIVSGMRASDVGSSQDIKVTAVETDGTTHCELWPPALVFSISAPFALPILGQLQNYLNARPGTVQLVTFLPERLRDPNTNTVNQSNFRNLARVLFESLSVAVMSFSIPSPRTPPSSSSSDTSAQGGGMLIFPVANSSAMLLGAVFMGQPFPDFVYAAQSPHQSLPPNTSASYATGSSRRSEPSISIPNISRSGSYPHASGSYDQHAIRHSLSPVSPEDQRRHFPPSPTTHRYGTHYNQAPYRNSPEPITGNVNISSYHNRPGYPSTGYTDPNVYQSSSTYPTQSVSPTDGNNSASYPSNRGSGGSASHPHFGE
ncbi:hypothetical protein Moror_16178 [Moniliophthora roreri MCA 2997]|uniref:Uncharacterized protein n=2 Tax=Moniliophthora roreri TaxID=221103 RepID=V2WRC4_MONRO|nr:hypothetical protein Moror_16178 [Moniliophthora roreri MCA 2997]KAI3614903.1 hypothetical protein WG66_016815 [Moniliophthora roreri]